MKFVLYISFVLISIYNSYGNVHIGYGQKYLNIQSAANAGAIMPGDTVFLHEGLYFAYQGITNLKGNSEKWIVFSKFQNDNIEIAGCWQFKSCEYIKFSNLNFKSNSQFPGRLLIIDNSGSCETQSKFIEVDSCIFSNTTDITETTAFKFAGVDNFEVTNCQFKDIISSEAMGFNSCHNGLISQNKFENCLSGGHIKGGGSDIIIERNLFMNSSISPSMVFELGGDTGAQFYCSGDNFEVKNLKFYSNIIIGGYRGVSLSSAIDCQIINNTFYNCGQATLRFLTTSKLYPKLSGNLVANNIFAFGASTYFNGGNQPSGAVSFANNIYYSINNNTFNGPYWDAPDLDLIKDQNPINYGSATPIFVDGNSNDFNLATNSPAIGTGLKRSEPMKDFYGNHFSTDSRSIGAIEFNTNVGIGEIIDKNISKIINIFPNPASDYITISLSNNGLQPFAAEDKVQIFDVLGIEVEDLTPTPLLTGEGLRIDICKSPTGVYFIKITCSNGACSIVEKFVKM